MCTYVRQGHLRAPKAVNLSRSTQVHQTICSTKQPKRTPHLSVHDIQLCGHQQLSMSSFCPRFISLALLPSAWEKFIKLNDRK